MFRSTTIIREPCTEPGQSYIYVKTLGKITYNNVILPSVLT